MSLEAEAEKDQGGFVPRSTSPRPRTRFDQALRWIAIAVLVAALSLIYWIPFNFLGAIGAAVVLAFLTLVAVRLASTVHELRGRIAALEASRTDLRGPEDAPPPSDPPRP